MPNPPIGKPVFLSRTPSRRPAAKPTRMPSMKPIFLPTRQLTRRPTPRPTSSPTKKPTVKPTVRWTPKPASLNVKPPTCKPTRRPALKPARQPTKKPTAKPTYAPRRQPTKEPVRPPPPLEEANCQTHACSATTTHQGTTASSYSQPNGVGDVPYTARQAIELTAQTKDLPKDAEFVIHVGDVLNREEWEPCPESDYIRAAEVSSSKQRNGRSPRTSTANNVLGLARCALSSVCRSRRQ
jgi:hypothetical protein